MQNTFGDDMGALKTRETTTASAKRFNAANGFNAVNILESGIMKAERFDFLHNAFDLKEMFQALSDEELHFLLEKARIRVSSGGPAGSKMPKTALQIMRAQKHCPRQVL